MARKKPNTPPAVVEKRQVKPREAAAIAAAREARANRPLRPEYIEVPSGTEGAFKIEAPHSDEDGLSTLVAETFATTSGDFVGANLLRLAQASATQDKPSMQGFNANLALIAGIAPQNELEAALAVQMAITHDLSLEMLRRTKSATRTDAMREYGNLATKLGRTFTAQMKQLSDWRRGGEQVVRHVHVYEGGQAVVAGTINLRGQGNGNGTFNPHEQGAILAPLLSEDPAGHPMPMSGDEGPEALPSARWQDEKRRGTQGE